VRNPDCTGPNDPTQRELCSQYAADREAEARDADGVARRVLDAPDLDGETELNALASWCALARIETLTVSMRGRSWHVLAEFADAPDAEAKAPFLGLAFGSLETAVYESWTAYAESRRDLATKMLEENDR